MSNIVEGTLLWAPTPGDIKNSNLSAYMEWLKGKHGLVFNNYPDLWSWSVKDLEDFWETIWDYNKIQASETYTQVLSERKMPGAEWFVGSELNYAEHVFRNMTPKRPALLYKAEDQPLTEVSWQELYEKTAAVRQVLLDLGIQRGDRVVAYLPHIPETIIAFLACASLGAIWSSCSPDFGGPSVLDRFQQIEPKILFATDGYTWNGKYYDRRDVIGELHANLPTLEKTILISQTAGEAKLNGLENTILWRQALDGITQDAEMTFEQVPFDHPLWVLYSSGTTGLPKPIVQSQGGILIEHLKTIQLQLDLKPEDVFFWYTSTGWMMWNLLTGGLLSGVTILLYNGSPAYPDMDVLWELAEESGATYFGASAAYVTACNKANIEPGNNYDLSQIRAFGSTGSPLSLDSFEWIYQNIHPNLALESVSGGTDLCTPFVGGCRLLPVYAGEIQYCYLGAKVEAYNPEGESVLDEVGELVVTEPMPSMPLYFWNDPGDRRYIASYFEMFPGIWRHGDWIKFNSRGGSVIYGRSDATIKRYGVRMGTSEIYQAVEGMDEIVESLVVDLEALGSTSFMPLFVVLREGLDLDKGLKEKINAQIRVDISPRHVPNEIYAIQKVPRTLSGKKLELPVRKILMGEPPEQAANLGTMRNPESIQFFIELANDIRKTG